MKTIGYESYTSWLVTVSCTVIFCLSTIPYRLAGLIFVWITEYYDADRETASIPILLFLLISCLGGPVFGVLGEKCGLETITVIGCVLSAMGFGTCFFAQNIVGVSLLLGIVYGVGVAFTTTFIPNIIKKHFTKNFTTANGIAHSGPCLGALFVPPAAIFLIDLYGASGACLILSGVMLNGIPLGIYIQRASALQSTLMKYQAHNVKRCDKDKNMTNKTKPKTLSVQNIECAENSEVLYTECQKVSQSTATQRHKLCEENVKNNETIEIKMEYTANDEVIHELPTSNKIDNKSLSKTSMNTDTETTENIKNTTDIPSSSPLQSDSKDKRRRNLYGLSVFTDISFLIIMVNISLALYVTTLFWTTMIDYSRDKGISRNLEIYFLMLQPLVDLIGRVCFGWVSDLGYLSMSNYAMLCYSQMALSMFFIMWTNRFEVMMAGACWYALTSGAILSVYPGIIFKCIEKDHQSMAIASKYTLFGVLTFISSPLIGYFRENLGSYDGLYCLFIAVCMVNAALIPLMFKFNKTAEIMTNDS